MCGLCMRSEVSFQEDLVAVRSKNVRSCLSASFMSLEVRFCRCADVLNLSRQKPI